MTKQQADLDNRLTYLQKLQLIIEEKLGKFAEGTVRICSSGGRVQYYHRRTASDRSGTYLRKEDADLIKELVDKDYYRRLDRAIREEISAIRSYMKKCPAIFAEDVYSSLPKHRRMMADPLIETDERVLERWKNTSYVGKTIAEDVPELLTKQGERVRSKSEMIFANMMADRDFPYKYECPLKLKGLGTIYPDFTIFDVRNRREIYWEHFGMMDNPDYARKAVNKIRYYNLSGLYLGDRLIVTFETEDRPIDIRQVNGILDFMLSR